MRSISEDMAYMLNKQPGIRLGKNLFISRAPSSPDNIITLYDTLGGRPSMLSLDSGCYEYDALQVIIRDNKYSDAMEMAYKIKGLLHGLSGEVVCESLYTVVKHQSGPALVEYDKNNRANIVINFLVQRRCYE